MVNPRRCRVPGAGSLNPSIDADPLGRPHADRLRGTARSLDEDVRVLLEKRLHQVVEGTAAAYGAKATLSYRRNYPVLVNHERETGFAASVAKLLFFIFLILLVVSFVMRAIRGNSVV